MNNQVKSIDSLIMQAVHIKENARKTTANIDKYQKAAILFDEASKLSIKFAKDSRTSDDDQVKHEIFGFYYSYEKSSCEGNYYYEKRDIKKAITHKKEALDAIKNAIEMVNTLSSKISTQVVTYLRTMLPNWEFYCLNEGVSISAANARLAWDNDQYIDALDNYRKAAKLQLATIKMTEALEPVYHRITLGNYIGMIVNASNALAQLTLEKATPKQNPDTSRTISNDAAIDMLRYTIEAYSLSKSAYNSNPEWDQYKLGASTAAKNIQVFLKDNLSGWLDFYIAFEYNKEFLTIMKDTNLERFKKVEYQRYFHENKSIKLWQIGGLFLFVFLIISCVVYLFSSSFSNFWYLLLSFVTIEVLYLITGGMVLRSVGDLSEKGFLKIVTLALQHQFKFNWFRSNKSDSSK